MSLASFSKNLLNRFCQQGIADRANFIKNVAVIGWVLSSLAQTCAIFFNDKIPSKEKRFLIPQEIFDGIINATLFWFITSKATNFGKKLVLMKRVVPKSLVNAMETFTPSGNNLAKMKDNLVSHVTRIGGEAHAKTAKDAVEGMGVLTGLVGAVVANNIVTPLLRNRLAGLYQAKEMRLARDNAPLNPYYGKLDYKKYDFSKPIDKMTTFKGYYQSQNMKI